MAEFFGDFHGIDMEASWDLHGIFMGFSWDFHGISPPTRWEFHSSTSNHGLLENSPLSSMMFPAMATFDDTGGF